MGNRAPDCEDRRANDVVRAAEARAQAGQFLAYAVVGTVATLVHYSLLIALVQAAGMDPLFSSTAGFVVGGVTAYFLNYTAYRHKLRFPHVDSQKDSVTFCIRSILAATQ
jgi:hypothetical protein